MSLVRKQQNTIKKKINCKKIDKKKRHLTKLENELTLKNNNKDDDKVDFIFSVCMTIKNRSSFLVTTEYESWIVCERTYIKCPEFKKEPKVVNEGKQYHLNHFENCVNSLINATKNWSNEKKIQLVVADFTSTDVNVEQLLQSMLKESENIVFKYVLINESKFSRGRGLNIAMDCAESDNLIFFDADMYLQNDNFLKQCMELFKTEDSAYFPICFCFRTPQHDLGWWEKYGYGMVGIKKSTLKGYRWEERNSWGLEDDNFHKYCQTLGLNIKRCNCHGLFHQWHPEAKSFKEQYM